MNDINYTEENIKILDSIDFSPYFDYIERGKSVWSFFDEIEKKFDNTELTNNDILEGCIFNWLGESELIEYFEKRYPDIFKVVEVYSYIFV